MNNFRLFSIHFVFAAFDMLYSIYGACTKKKKTEKSCSLSLKQRYVNVSHFSKLFFYILCTIMTKLSLLRAELKYIHSHTENLQK